MNGCFLLPLCKTPIYSPSLLAHAQLFKIEPKITIARRAMTLDKTLLHIDIVTDGVTHREFV